MENSNNFSAGESLMENAFMANEQERSVDEKEKLRVEVQQDLGEKTILSVNLKDGLNVKYEEGNDNLEKKAKLEEEAKKAEKRLEEENKLFDRGTKATVLNFMNRLTAGERGKGMRVALLAVVVATSLLSGCGKKGDASNPTMSTGETITAEYGADNEQASDTTSGTEDAGTGVETEQVSDMSEFDAKANTALTERKIEYQVVSENEGPITVEYVAKDVNADVFARFDENGNAIEDATPMTAEVRAELSEALSPDRLVLGENYNKGKLATDEGQYIGFNAVSTRMYTEGEQISDDDFVDRFVEKVANEYTASAQYVTMLDLDDLHNLNASRDIIEIFERDGGTKNLYERLVNYGRLGPTYMDELTRLGEAALKGILEDGEIEIADVKNTERYSPYLRRDADGNVVKGDFGKARGGSSTIKAIRLAGENGLKYRMNYIINNGLEDEINVKTIDGGVHTLKEYYSSSEEDWKARYGTITKAELASQVPEIDLSGACTQPTMSAGIEAEPSAGASESEWVSAAAGEDEPSAAGSEGEISGGNENEWGKGATPWHFEDNGVSVDTNAGPTEKPNNPTLTEVAVDTTPTGIQETPTSATSASIDTSSHQGEQGQGAAVGGGGNAEEASDQGTPTQYSAPTEATAEQIQQMTVVGEGNTGDEIASSQQGQGGQDTTPPFDAGSTPGADGTGTFSADEWDF